MNPAYSIIFFTTASGTGYGLIALLGIYAWGAHLPASSGFGLLTLGIGFALVVAGLVSSTCHLGHPERAWRALSQWRSSWLAREGVAAVLTFIPIALFALLWIVQSKTEGAIQWIGLLSTIGALITVVCTGMIYASLRAIPSWYTAWVPWCYLALGAMTGGLWLAFLSGLFGVVLPGLDFLVPCLVVIALIVKLCFWAAPRAAPVTKASATGLGTFAGQPAQVVPLDSPHTEQNYLQREMGYVIARKHASQLREHAVLLCFALPLMFAVLGAALSGSLSVVAHALAAVLASVGVVMERWLFFAEAKHTMSVFYGESQV
jgi:DMSO reductase anchor subunit